jgi:hypothetical protein
MMPSKVAAEVAGVDSAEGVVVVEEMATAMTVGQEELENQQQEVVVATVASVTSVEGEAAAAAEEEEEVAVVEVQAMALVVDGVVMAAVPGERAVSTTTPIMVMTTAAIGIMGSTAMVTGTGTGTAMAMVAGTRTRITAKATTARLRNLLSRSHLKRRRR